MNKFFKRFCSYSILVALGLISGNIFSQNVSVSVNTALDHPMKMTIKRGSVIQLDQDDQGTRDLISNTGAVGFELVNIYRRMNWNQTTKPEHFCGSPLSEFYRDSISEEVMLRYDDDMINLCKVAKDAGLETIIQIGSLPVDSMARNTQSISTQSLAAGQYIMKIEIKN